MKAIVTVFAIAMMGSLNAQASFDGTFRGTGKVTSQGQVMNCENVVITIKHTPTVMDIDSKFYCGGKTVQGPMGVLTLRGSEVFNAAGTKIGTVSETMVDLNSDSADGFMTSTERLNGNTMTFKTVHGNKKSGVTTIYEGTATR